jgi:hypothetical protein
MSVSVGISNGQLLISGAADNANHTITLDHSGPNNGSGNTFVQVDNGVSQSFADASITAGISINDGNGNGTINIRATVKPTFVEGQGGFDHVTLGNAGNMQGIQGPVTITHLNAVGNIALTLDDSNDPAAQNPTLGVSNGFGTVTGLAPGTISYKAADVGLVTINSGSGGNTYTVADTVVNNRAGFGGTVINTGINASTVNVLGTTGNLLINAQGTLGVNGSAFGFDRVNVGNAHSVQGIHGQLLLVTQGTKSATLELDDSADKTARTVTVNNVSVSGLAPTPILFNNSFAGIELIIDGGSGGNTFQEVGGADLTSIHGGTGNDTVNVGSPDHSLDNIHGIFDFVGQGTNDIVNLNDQGTTHAEAYTFEALTNGGNDILRDDGTSFFFGFSVFGTTKHVVVNGAGSGNTFNVQDTFGAADTTLNTGLGADTVNVQGTTGALTVNGQDGADIVNVGLNGSVQGIKGALTITNAGDFSALNVDDHLDHTGRTVTMNDFNVVTTNVLNAIGTITGLAPATITYPDGGVSSVTVSGGDGGNTYIVENTAAIGRGPVTTLNTGIGRNFVTVQRTTGTLVVNGQGGADLVDVGLNGSVQNIFGAVTVTNAGGFSTLVADNSADTVNRVVNMGVAGGFGSITGLSPATISYLANGVSQVQVLGGNGSNKYTINDTVRNSSNPTTIIRGGTRNDTFNLLGSTGTLQIDGGGGNDVVNVGGTSTGAGSVKGTLGLGDTGGKIRLEVFDGGDITSDTVQVTSNSVIGLAGQIEFNPTQLTSATLRLDGAPDNVFVSSTPAGVPITIVDGGNIDIIRVGSAANTLDGIQGPLIVDGSISGINVLIINDQGSKTPHVYTETATTLSRSGAAPISFFNVESVAVNKGPVLGKAPAAKELKLTRGPKGSRLVTLTGHLTDADRATPLALTVDWGDGTTPQTSTPNRKPFSLKHSFQGAGTGTVRVIWTDTRTHESNFQDLRLTATPATPSTAPHGHSRGHGIAVPRR